jgi:hypothetical protein
MATENKGVMVYLPKEVEEYITNFCTEYNITRKDKEGNVLPSLGTGVVTYLKSQMSGENPGDILTKPSKTLGTGLTKEEVIDLISEYITSNSTSNVPDLEAVDNRISEAIDNRVLPLIESATARVVADELLKTSADTTALEEMVKVNVEPLADLLAELDTCTQSQFAAVRDEIKKPTAIAQ